MTSRREEKDRRRAERLAAEQSASEQAKRRRTYSIVVGAVLGIAALAAIVAVAATGGGGNGHDVRASEITGDQSFSGAATPPSQTETDLFAAARAAGCVLRNPVIEGRQHVEPGTDVEYKTNPPTSGNHDPAPAGDGVYSNPPTTATTRNFVHTLEHGRILIQYDPSLRKRYIDQLGGLFNEDPYHMVLMPNRRLGENQVAVTAWGHLLGCEKVTDETFDAIRGFRDRYRDQGPEQAA
jgi:uncharacterized protein DUF3105